MWLGETNGGAWRKGRVESSAVGAMIEEPKTPKRVECGEGFSTAGGVWEGAVPLPNN